MRKPGFFLVGAPKAGTTSLMEALAGHPQVFVSPIKEPNYYCDDLRAAARGSLHHDALPVDLQAYLARQPRPPLQFCFIENYADYLRLFEDAGEARAIGEGTSTYLLSQTAAGNIARDNPEARIIAVLRNPVKRAFSHYLMDKRIGIADRSFAALIRQELEDPSLTYANSSLYVETGKYARQLQRYLEVLPREQILVLLYEDLIGSQEPVVRQVKEFLGIDPAAGDRVLPVSNQAAFARFDRMNRFLHRTGIKRYLRLRLPRSFKQALKSFYFRPVDEQMGEEERVLLTAAYRQDILMLEDLLGRKLPLWLDGR